MNAEVQIILPEVSEDAVSLGLRRLTEILHINKLADISGGVLGGEFGYGADYSNDAFEMFPFWWGDCECNHDEAESTWYSTHDHAEDCYQRELARRGLDHFVMDDPDHDQRVKALCDEYGVSYPTGSLAHCTCGHDNEWRRWDKQNPHDPRCPEVRPNFLHKPSGSEVRWYKYIGRSMEVNLHAPWDDIFAECIQSLKVAS